MVDGSLVGHVMTLAPLSLEIRNDSLVFTSKLTIKLYITSV